MKRNQLKLSIFLLPVIAAIGLFVTACSSDDENSLASPFVGRWQLVELYNIDDGSLKYSLKRDGKKEGVIDYVFYSDGTYKAIAEDVKGYTPTNLPYSIVSGNRIVLYWTPETSPFTEYEYEFLENGTKLKMILSSTDVDVFPYKPEIKIYEKIEK